MSKPEKDAQNEPVRRIKSPVRLQYTVTAGRELSHFLGAITQGRFIGQRCPVCQKVYVPPRGGCPTCGVAGGDEIAVADTGTVTTFCIVNVPFEGQTMKLPYVYACIVLDGADNQLYHVVDAPVEAVRMGLRVRAEWLPEGERRPTLESIRCFKPTGEPDAPFASYQEHL